MNVYTNESLDANQTHVHNIYFHFENRCMKQKWNQNFSLWITNRRSIDIILGVIVYALNLQNVIK